jgi:transposase
MIKQGWKLCSGLSTFLILLDRLILPVFIVRLELVPWHYFLYLDAVFMSEGNDNNRSPNKFFSMILKIGIGLDVSSKKISIVASKIDDRQKVTIISSGEFQNSATGIDNLEKWIRQKTLKIIPGLQLSDISICLEATGVYHENAAYFLKDKGYRVSVVNPTVAKYYLKGCSINTKNDNVDAKGLARMACEKSLDVWNPISINIIGLRDLTRHYQALQEQITVNKNMLHATNNGAFESTLIIRQLNETIQLLTKLSAEIVSKTKAIIKDDKEIQEKVQALTKIEGVGLKVATTILAETGGFRSFNNHKQVVSFSGLDVVENQSGKHIGKTKISKKGNARIRRMLYMAALSIVKLKKGNFYKLFERVYQRTGIKQKAVVAVMRKILVMMFHVCKSNLVYDPQFRRAISEKEQEHSLPASVGRMMEKVAV